MRGIAEIETKQLYINFEIICQQFIDHGIRERERLLEFQNLSEIEKP